MPVTADCIVLGVGGFGSGALYHLAKRGARVVGLEQFGEAHDRGSSHGETRIIRKAYFEHANYVPLLHRAYDLWHELEVEEGRKLLHQVGLFVSGPADSESVAGTIHAARIHQLPLDQLTSREAQSRFPAYHFPEHFTTVFESQAGYLDVENCVQAHIDAAVRHGAILKTGERVLGWEAAGTGVRVRTDKVIYEAAKLVITAGAWSGPLLAELGLPLQVVRKPVFWFPTTSTHYDVAAGNSTFFFEMPAGQFYGFPRLDGRSVKAGEHTSGDPVTDPSTVDRSLHAIDVQRVADFVRECLPGLSPEPVKHSVCLYTRTPDGHFIIDRHPEHANVVFAAGFSGHGFKFCSVLGETLAELALTGTTTQPIEFLSMSRATLRK